MDHQNSDGEDIGQNIHEGTISNRLILSKRFFQHAIEHSTKPGTFDRMISVHHLHLSIEIVIRTIALRYGDRGFGFDLGIGKLANNIHKNPLVKEKGLSLPYMQQVNEITSWRNLAQHSSIEPDSEQLFGWITITRQFLIQTFSDFFGQDFVSITTISLIQNNELRNLLLYCNKLLSQLEEQRNERDDQNVELINLTQNIMAILTICFAFMFGTARWYLPSHVIERHVDPPLLEIDDKDKVLKIIWERLRDQEIANLCQLLGIDYWVYQELVEWAPSILLDEKDQVWIIPQNDFVREVEEYRRLLEFEIEIITTWESKSWFPSKIGLGDEAYSVAAAHYYKGETVQLLDTGDIPKIKSNMDLGNVIRNGYPEFLAGTDFYI